MDNSKSMKDKNNKLHTGSVLTVLIVAGAFCISTAFMDLAWAKANSFLRPSLAKEDWVIKALEGKLQNKKQPGAPATLLAYMHKEGIFSDNSKKAKEMAGKRGGNDSLVTIYRELKILRAVGLVEGVRDDRGIAYYLPGWLRDVKIEDVVRENPELKCPNPNEKQTKETEARVKTARFEALKELGILVTGPDLSPSFFHKIDYQIIIKTNEGKSLSEIGKELNRPHIWTDRWGIIAKLAGKKRKFGSVSQLREDMKKGMKNLEEVSASLSSWVERPQEEVKQEILAFWKRMEESKSGKIDYLIMTEINKGKTLIEIKDKFGLSYPAVWGHSWGIIAKLEGKKNWTFKEVYSNTKQVRGDMKKGIKNLEEVSAGFSFLVNKPVEQVAKELELFWKNMQYPKIDKSLVKALEITGANKNFVNSIKRFKKAEKVLKAYDIRIKELKDECKTVADRHKFSIPQTLILYSEPLLKNCGVIDLKESLDILLRNNVVDKVILYADNPAYNHIVKGLIKKSAPDLKITTKTNQELGLKDNATEVEEIETLIGEEKNILCIIKGTVEARSRGQLKDLSRNRNIPIVVFKEVDGKHIYSLAEAFKAAITTQEMLIDLPAVKTENIEDEIIEYQKSLQAISGA